MELAEDGTVRKLRGGPGAEAGPCLPGVAAMGSGALEGPLA